VRYGPAWVTRELAKLDAELPVTLIKLENKWLRERAAMRRERMRAAFCRTPDSVSVGLTTYYVTGQQLTQKVGRSAPTPHPCQRISSDA
jgi:hypothetical protein